MTLFLLTIIIVYDDDDYDLNVGLLYSVRFVLCFRRRRVLLHGVQIVFSLSEYS